LPTREQYLEPVEQKTASKSTSGWGQVYGRSRLKQGGGEWEMYKNETNRRYEGVDPFGVF
jgi:hypothetical protein